MNLNNENDPELDRMLVVLGVILFSGTILLTGIQTYLSRKYSPEITPMKSLQEKPVETRPSK